MTAHSLSIERIERTGRSVFAIAERISQTLLGHGAVRSLRRERIRRLTVFAEHQNAAAEREPFGQFAGGVPVSRAVFEYALNLSENRQGEGDRHILLRGLRKMSQSPGGFRIGS